ncbi:MAG: GreA/GreB family elongation factor [Sphaerochaetaceae bacterium]|nr:GreA/GreB family elongation factor [Sphaerochaetaceae bacterium]
MNAKKVRELISNELWNTTSTSQVKTDDFVNLQTILKKLKSQDEKADFRELCLAALEDKPRSPIVPRFILSVTGRHPVDDSYIISVFEEYYQDSRWEDLIYMGNLILSFNESSYVLKVLAEAYSYTGHEDKKIETWEYLIRIDHVETSVFYSLAEYYNSRENFSAALNMYKRVIQRHINAQDMDSVAKAWSFIYPMDHENASYLLQVAGRISRSISKEAAETFLIQVYGHDQFDNNSKILILKKILEFSPDNKTALDQLIDIFRTKYADNPRLEYCLSNTGLLHNYMDINTAVANFEKEIGFVEGAFVIHATWGLGRIKKIEKDEMYIQFLKKKDLHKMSCNMAFSSLKIVPKQHILVLKAGATPAQIRDHLMDNIEWGLRMLLNSFGGQASLKQIKAELVPSVLKDSEWSSWQSLAKKELATNPYFSISDDAADVYVLRDTPITFEEKTLQIFQREKGFFKKYAIVKDFINKNGSTDSEEFMKILDYFEEEAKYNSATGFCSCIILDKFKNKQSMTFIHLNETFEEKYNAQDREQIKAVYSEIDDSELKKAFVDCIKETDEKWQAVLGQLLRVSPSTYLMDCVKNGPRRKMLSDIISDAVDNYQGDPDFLLFLLKNCSSEDWEKASIDESELLLICLQALIFVSGRVSHNVDTQLNKARQKTLSDMLFTDQMIVKNLETCDTQQAKRIYSYVSNVPGIEEDKIIGVKHFILSKRKDADSIFATDSSPATPVRMIPKGFLCTRAMFVAKSAELDHIMNVEIPENSREIGVARDLGDLRENAEYQYAKDKQKNLNFMMNKLTDEIDIAKIIESENVDTSYVEFGTKVVFHDNIANEDITYTIFGPWESNPDKNILNFQAPLGLKIYNMQKDENRKFEINGVKMDLTVKSIELADFDLK